MKSEKECLTYIMDCMKEFSSSDINLLKKIPAYVYKFGLDYTMEFLFTKRSENDSERHIFQFIYHYLFGEEGMNKDQCKFPSDNRSYAECVRDTMKLCKTAILISVHPESNNANKKYNVQLKGKEYMTRIEHTEQELLDIQNSYLHYYFTSSKKDLFVRTPNIPKEYIHHKKNKIRSIYSKEKWYTLNFPLQRFGESRMLIGAGQTIKKELYFHMNFLYGIPELPATAIKGVFRSFCEQDGHISEAKIKNWFGDEENEGKIIFLTATPEQYTIKKDIISNQYGNYYQQSQTGGKMNFPTLKEPNLVNFYAVEIKDMTIQMIIGKDNRDKDDIEKAFLECIQVCNFGAKGAVGYGYLEKKN